MSNESSNNLLTLEQWHNLLNSCNNIDTAAKTQPQLYKLLINRYGNDETTLNDRLNAYKQVINNLYDSNTNPNRQAQFDRTLPIVFIASPGRDRIFMGHTDFNGLGGHTFDCATKEE